MTTKYADRAFISVNGSPLIDVQSATLKQTRNAKPVPSMTKTPFNTGYTEGNRDIDITCVIAVRNATPSLFLETVNYESNDVQITFKAGQDTFVATGVFLKDSEEAAGGVGDEVKRTLNFGALAFTNATAGVVELANFVV